MRRHIAIVSLLTALCAQGATSLQPRDTIGTVIDEVTVLGRQAPTEARSVAPIRIFDKKLMLRSGVTDVSDALHRMPGVTLRDYGGAGGLKTVSVRGFGAGHTGVCYDGVPLSDVQSGQIDLSRYSIDNVGRVSLTTTDGDDIFIPARMAASASSVSISSEPLTERMELIARIKAGSFGFVNPSLRVGCPVGRRDGVNGAFNIVGDYTHADNNYPFTLRNVDLVTREKRTNSKMDCGHGEANMLLALNERNRLTAKLYYYNCSRQLPGPVVYYNNVSHEQLRESNAMAQAQWRSTLSDKFSLNGLVKFNWACSKYHDENGKYPGGELNQFYWQREYYTSWALLYTPAPGWLLDYSADYFYNNLNSNLITDGHPYRNSILQSVTAKYKSGRFTAIARVLGSLYYNGAKSGEAARNAKKLSPSLSLSYKPLEQQLFFVRASYKNIFRMPTFNEAYFDHYGSKDILPESTEQLNLGVTYTLSHAAGPLTYATFAVDAYLNHVRDMIVAVPYNMFLWSMVNLGKVRAFGIDATGQLTFTAARGHDVSFSYSYSYQRAMPRTNPESSEWMKQVAYIPKHSFSASVSYENPWVNLSFSSTGVSARYASNNNLPGTRVAGYVECGLTAWHTFALRNHSLDLRADILNLLDHQYYVVARYPMPGRQYRFTLTFTL